MKLSELIAYHNQLAKYSIHPAVNDARSNIEPIEHLVRTHKLQYSNFQSRITGQLDKIIDDIKYFGEIVDALSEEILSEIKEIQPRYLAESYRFYEQELSTDSDELILNRRPGLSEDVISYLRGRILRHSDWHYPGMIIRPGLESWIDDLVALDPLYLVDTHYDLLTPSLDRFNEQYRSRLRPYVIKENSNQPMFSMLPPNQFGFVLAYNFFHFKPLEIVRQFMNDVFRSLAPGGTFAFTFNDCDRSGAVELCERFFMCFTPGSLILAAAELEGFELLHRYEIDAAATWLELRKPGELKSLRGGQSLARIVTKN